MVTRAMLDPLNPDFSVQQLDELCGLSPETLLGLRHVIASFPRSAQVTLDERGFQARDMLTVNDLFTFDPDTDDLVLFSRDETTCVNALVEMAMYLSGFATLMGIEDEWVVEFAIGAWRNVRNRLKREFDLPVPGEIVAMVGEPPESDAEPYPFREMVSAFDTISFHHMVVLAGREEIAVYFPPETNPKVLAAYIYTRRAIHEVGKSIELEQCQEFNTRLLDGIQRLDTLFWPAGLRATARPDMVDLRHLGGNPFDDDLPPGDPGLNDPDNPFATFIEDLLDDDPAGDAAE
ncbi:hypothetical protein [Aggregatilinea lenta]|uniref:hypothetical protein n=1 Tax=Aggregatilinea lenta TaxID=913108 RepID=UPI000E5AA49D|nr:hypothetical protein [Aggregatilinea lenta]